MHALELNKNNSLAISEKTGMKETEVQYRTALYEKFLYRAKTLYMLGKMKEYEREMEIADFIEGQLRSAAQ